MISRRRFGLAGGAAAFALLAARFDRRIAKAAPPTHPVRFLAVRSPHGVDRNFWIPRQMNGAEPATPDEALSGLTFEYENSILNALMPWRSQITVLDGLDTQCVKENTRAGLYANHGHNEQGTMLTGAQAPANREGNFDNHPSLDFWLHGQLGAPVLLTSSVEGAGTWKCMSFDDAGSPRNAETSPSALFQQAFPADFEPPDPEDPVIDYAAGENRITTHGQTALTQLEARLKGVEKDKIEAHREAMKKLIETETPTPVGYCMTSGSDVPNVSGSVGDYSNVENVTRAHAAVIAQAFACGRSMTATLRILDDYPNYYTDVPEVQASGAAALYGADFRFHENLVHDYWGNPTGDVLATLREGYCAGQRWAAGHFAAVLDELSKVVDPYDPMGGSILDNTIVFWHNEFGHDGHDNQHTRHPAIIAGGGNRSLRLGRYLRLRDINGSERVPHNKLLTSICHAVGLEDVNFFGDRDLEDRPEYQGPLDMLMV